MRDQKRAQNMNNYSSRRRAASYGREMDQAFTLIFHNIKRLQDGVLSNSDPNLASAKSYEQPDLLSKKPAMIPKPAPFRKRSRSEPLLGLTGELQQVQSSSDLTEQSKSGSPHLLSEASKSPTQRRKVRFADDCEKEREKDRRSPQLSPLATEGVFFRYGTQYESSRSKDEVYGFTTKKET